MTDIRGPWADRSIVDDPYPFYAQLRERAPVWRVPGTRTFFVAPWDLVAEAVARVDDFSSNLTAVLITGPDGGATEFDMTPLGPAINVLATGDEPDHSAQRKLVAPHFTAGRLAALEKELDGVMDALWADCVAQLDGCVEWMAAVGDRLPMTLVARVIGLPDDDVGKLISLGYQGTDLLGGLLLLLIAVRLLMDRESKQPVVDGAESIAEAGLAGEDAERSGKQASRSFLSALLTILVADVTMSLDNVLAVGALAAGRLPLLVAGLLLSMGLLLVGSAVVALLIGRLPWLLDVAALV